MNRHLRTVSLLFLVVALFAALVAATPAVLPTPNQPTAAATANAGELQVTWQATPGAQFYTVGWANQDEIAQMTQDGREWLDAFHFSTVPGGYTRHTISGLKTDAEYFVIIGAQSARFGASDLVWSPWSNPATTAGQHGAGFCPITGLPIPEGGYLEVGETKLWSDGSFRLTSATTPATRVSGGTVYAPYEGDRLLRLCGTLSNQLGYATTNLAGYDNNLATDAGIGFTRHTDGTDWLEIGRIEDGETASACDTWTIPGAATTAVYAIFDTANNAVLFRIDLTASPAAAAPSVDQPAAESSPVAAASQRHIDEKRFMLDLINAERAKVGANPVVLGNNVAAQLHAESSIESCFLSHWGTDGLKPYMRYALASGYQSNSENGSGSSYCLTPADGYAPITDVKSRIARAMASYMQSDGHRINLLNSYHRKVNIGLAWDQYHLTTAQHFEGDYFTYDQLPTISGDTLAFSGSTKNGAQWAPDLSPQIFFDPPPGPLTRGQLARTYCYDNGPQVAALRPPLRPGYHYPDDTVHITEYRACPSPYEVPASAAPPGSLADRDRIFNAAVAASLNPRLQIFVLEWITGSRWRVQGNAVSVTANLERLLEQYGDGVYTLVLWGKIGGESVVVSQYPIFHGVTPPDTYSSAAQ